MTTSASDGWLIEVDTERLGGGRPAKDIYAVWESDPVAALAKVEQKFLLTADEIPQTLAPVSEAHLRGLGVEPGNAVHIIASM